MGPETGRRMTSHASPKLSVTILGICVLSGACMEGGSIQSVTTAAPSHTTVTSTQPATTAASTTTTTEATNTTTQAESQTVNFAVGETASYDDEGDAKTLAVNSVRIDAKGGDFVSPAVGFVWVILDVSYGNESAEVMTVSTLLEFTAFDSEGREIEQSIFADVDGSLDGDVLPGMTRNGEIAYEVPEGEKEVLFVWTPDLFGAERAVWTVPLP